MNRIFLSMLAITMLASCSKSEPNNKEDLGEKVSILLGAGVSSSTKAPILKGNKIEAGIAGWESATAPANYAKAPTWSDGLISLTADPTVGQPVTWDNGTQKYYNADNGIATYMKAWYPRGTVNLSVPTAPKVTFANTAGDVDAMLAPVVSGSKDAADGKTLAFAHKTTQLQFQVKSGTGLAAGTTIKKITVKQIELPIGFDLATDAVTWAAAANKDIANITASQVIGTTAANAGNPIMFKPRADNSLQIDVETSGATYTSKTFATSDSKLSEGSAYVVTLTFTQSGIELKATVAPWTSATGTGEIK